MHVYLTIGDIDRFAAWTIRQAIVWGFPEESGSVEAGLRRHGGVYEISRRSTGEVIITPGTALR